MNHPQLQRIDDNRIRVENPYGIEVVVFANPDVPVEAAAVDELLGMLEIQRTAERFYQACPDCFSEPPRITRVAVTPDFHKAKGIPVGTVLATRGFVVPQAIGNDVNCGMRLHLTSLAAEQVARSLDDLETALRRLFFEGGRDIPMTREQRQAMFTNGLTGLLDATPRDLDQGLWALFHQLDIEADLPRIDNRGSLQARRTFGLDDFMGVPGQYTRDSQIGSIGGGNHFVEIQRVKRIIDGATAHAWGIKPDMVTVMVHTGSVSIGHLSGVYYQQVVRAIYPSSLKYPENKLFLVPEGERFAAQCELFRDALHNAGNFAFANRLFLAIMALSALHTVCGDSDFPLLYDAPHNFLWKTPGPDGNQEHIHRKGACPARGMESMADTPFAYYGEPVLVPGSMGASSFILAGRGNPKALNSASHGAGRSLSRGQSLRGHDQAFAEFLQRFRIVTPVDLKRQDIKQRRDILDRKLNELKQEAPFVYKGIGPVIQTLESADMARPVAELEPLMTVKG